MSEALHRSRTQRILVALLVIQAAILALMFSGNPSRVPEYLGFSADGQGTGLAWTLAAITTFAYVWSASSLSDVKHHLFRPDRLKLFAVAAAVMAGIIEEVIFRKLVMDALQARGFGSLVQIAASALSFGVVHLVWGVKSLAAGINAALSTTILGAALAVVYIVGERSLAPSVVAHVLISGLIEPGLMLAAVSGRIGLWRESKSV
jgi:membrane protease YdiL (CAAX protease family)